MSSEGGILLERVSAVVHERCEGHQRLYEGAAKAQAAAATAKVAAELEVCLQAARRDAVCVLDWDDTLFPTSCLNALNVDFRGMYPMAEEVALQMSALQTLVVQFLDAATKHGAVMIVTNGEKGWVEHSSSVFMPKVNAFLVSRGIKVVSARSLYEHEAPHDPSHWKIQAFLTEMAPVLDNEESAIEAQVNFLSFGDGISEIAASHRLRQELPSSSVKTVKFLEFPTIDQLARQVYMVTDSFPELSAHPHSVDLSLAALTGSA
mmetsp:Transcript_13409/g.29086  ORF Transcript_13409/g.29086 Transcript_13409/m.29086 type:complete len:263 (+) Transcript_13409:78-866(+)|eukprot:CAMPEP_0185847010 /NCGR_PEP_ID=MMETSP1354-20130828/2440_1 /TAXON_ID=708628 /ORGANISM="Erythrolobus madagascarensis, Strain CCMP3276" /LENGTH=262 /DNA_ID=CAMNT_0028547249 /DNA_START=74 /DNA_END=862 /DNA_ORIENTATION=-